MTSNDQDTPLFTIGVAAGMLKVHPQTLRLYERLGFVIPPRTKGRSRLYTQRNIDQVRLIMTLTRRHRVNLAGVGIILKLQCQIEDIRRETDGLMKTLKKSVEREPSRSLTSAQRSRTVLSRPPAVKIRVERG